MRRVKVGCCGWAIKGGRKAYFKEFSLIELQSTFYKLPRPETARKWRTEAPDDFEYTLKAWQVITHPASSPTWRKARLKIDESIRSRYGFLKPTEENFKAWERTLEICKILKAQICVFQTPPSFRPSEENLENLKAFFSSISRDGIQLAWEPRGVWNQKPDLIRKICDELDLIHVVDLLKRWPLSSHEIAYVRLHGLGGEINYRYKYTEKDLRELLRRVFKLLESKALVYVLFNNIYMGEDAKRFKQMIETELEEEAV